MLLFQCPPEFFDDMQGFYWFFIAMLCCSKLPSHWRNTQTWGKLSSLLMVSQLSWQPASTVLGGIQTSISNQYGCWQLLVMINNVTNYSCYDYFALRSLSCKPIYLHALPWYIFYAVWYFNCNSDRDNLSSYSYWGTLTRLDFSIDFYSYVSEPVVHAFLSVSCNPVAHFSTFLGLERDQTMLWGR